MSMDVEELEKNYSWMVRPCVLYEEEYSDCKSIKSRFHQRFVNGTFADCIQWKYDIDNCYKWNDRRDPKALKELIESESKRREDRLNAHDKNNVWSRRKEPPSNWNAPLPAWMEEKMKASYLARKADDMKLGKQSLDFCVIS